MKLIIEVEHGTVTGIYYTDSAANSPEVCALPEILACNLDAFKAGEVGMIRHVAIGLKRANPITQQILTGVILG